MNHDTDSRSVRATGLPIACAAIALLAACSSPETTPDTSGYAPGERIGTYDGRAVVIAHANGPRFATWLRELREQHDAAAAAGERAKAEALEQKAVDQQERFHDQAFRGDDVDDVLALVRDRIPAICAESHPVPSHAAQRAPSITFSMSNAPQPWQT